MKNNTRKTKTINNQLHTCTLCPRNCRADRDHGRVGVCKQTATLRIARAALHMWEEPCISGTRGSGAVFFTGCPLGCVFCQNQEIAYGNQGIEISVARLSQIFLELQAQGANNINLVTPTHFIPQIAEALRTAKKEGLHLPVVYNTSGYERVDSLQQLEGLVDIYLPDFKYVSSRLSARYSHAADYFSVAKDALAEMVRQVGAPVFATDHPDVEEGMMLRGIIVRHLVLPNAAQQFFRTTDTPPAAGFYEDTKKVLHYLYSTYQDQIYISILNQYTPMEGIASSYPELASKIPPEDYDALVDYAITLGIENGFIQEGDTASESFIPDFQGQGVLSSL